MTFEALLAALVDCEYMTMSKQSDGSLYIVLDGSIILPGAMYDLLRAHGVEEV